MRWAGGVAVLAAVVAVASTAAAGTTEVTPARVITVSSIPALQAAADRAQPGDRIELVDGVYTTSRPIRLTRSGTSSARITVAAQHVGRAEIRGSAGFSFDGPDYVVVEGFRFTHSGGISIPAGSHHIRFTRNVLQLAGSVTNWVTVVGDHAEVSYNAFQNKSTEGVFLQISGPGDRAMAQRPWVHHNYFHNHTFSGANGGESIRLGYSYRQLSSAYAVVEHNLFERANGDSEAISVKSSDNVVRHNTIRSSRGSIVLRHGNRNLVEGNLMLGGSSGLRFYDNDHVLVNNLIQGGSGQIIAGSGTVADDTTGSTAHARPDRVLVAFNTVVGNRTNLLQVGQGTDRLGPNACTFANNILVGGGSGALIDIDEGTNLRWQGSIVWAGTGGNAPSSGYRVVNPALVTDSGGLRRLSSGSPAIDTAVGSYPQVTRDMDLATRTTPKDVGADEYAATGAQRRPLTTADVGPHAGSPDPGAQASWQLRWAPEAGRDGLRAFDGVEDDRADSHPAGQPHIYVVDNNYRFDMHMVDRDTYTDRQRQETRGMRWPAGGGVVRMYRGQLWRFTYSMYIPSSLKATTTFSHIMQLKAPGSTAPIIVTSLRRVSGVQKIELKVHHTNTLVGRADLTPLHNRWIDVQFEMRIGDAPNGSVRWVIRNGGTTVIDVSRSGLDTWLQDWVHPKFGIYRSLGDTSGSLQDCHLLVRSLRAYQWA